MRSFLVGLYSGLLLAALRAPLGLDLLQVPGRLPEWSSGYRAAALVLVAMGVAVGLRKAPERFAPIAALAGATLGFTLQWLLVAGAAGLAGQLVFSLLLVVLILTVHRRGPDVRPSKWRFALAAALAFAGWLVLDAGAPAGHAQALVVAVLGVAAILGVGALAAPERARADAIREILETRPASPAGLAGLAIAGAGLAGLGEGVGRYARELGGGTPLHDALAGTVFLALALFGALAFGRLFERGGSRALARGIVLATSGVGAWAALRVLANISTPRGLDRFVRRFGLDLSRHGMLDGDALVAATVFVVPAFLLGTVLALCRRPLELAALLVGAAAGTAAVPVLLAYHVGAGDGGALEVLSSSSPAGLAMAGAALAAAGALFAVATAGELPGRRRALGAGVAIAGGLFSLLLPLQRIEIVAPWLRNPPNATLVLEGPEGQITLERAPTGGLYATLDRRRLCPPPEAAGIDVARIAASWELLDEGKSGERPAVLLLGQLTPERAFALEGAGAGRIDRTASWYEAMPLLEEALFEGRPDRVGGEVLSPARAAGRLARGEYDLVLVPPTPGERVALPRFDAPEETTVVVWLDAADGYESEGMPAGVAVLPWTPDLVELDFAAVRGPGVEARIAGREVGAPRPLPTLGAPVRAESPLALLRTRPEKRQREHRAAFARRLAAVERVPGILGGLAVLFEAQEQSSPMDSWELAVELPEEAMVRISEAAAGADPPEIAMQATAALAAVLRGKRRIEEIERFLVVPAEKHAPWPALELALAQADLEFLDPESAVERLSRLLDGWRGNADAWAMLAEGHQQLGEEAEALDCLRRARELDPSSEELERRLTVARVRAGDPGGAEALAEALAEHPEDPELLRHQGEGPYPAVPTGYHPLGGGHHDAH